MNPACQHHAGPRLQRRLRWTRLATETSLSVSNRLTGMKTSYRIVNWLVPGALVLLLGGSALAQQSALPPKFGAWINSPASPDATALPQPLQQELGGTASEGADY